MTIPSQQTLPPLPIPKSIPRHPPTYIKFPGIVIFEVIRCIPYIQPIHRVVVGSRGSRRSVDVVGHQRHEDILPIPKRPFPIGQNRVIPNKMGQLKKGRADIALHEHKLGQDHLRVFVRAFGAVSVEHVVRLQVTTEAAHDAVRVFGELDDELGERGGGELHVVVDVYDPGVGGELAEVEAEAEAHLVVVLRGVDVDDLGVDVLEGGVGVGVEQQHLVHGRVREQREHEGALAQHAGPGVVHDDHGHLVGWQRQRDVFGGGEQRRHGRHFWKLEL